MTVTQLMPIIFMHNNLVVWLLMPKLDGVQQPVTRQQTGASTGIMPRSQSVKQQILPFQLCLVS